MKFKRGPFLNLHLALARAGLLLEYFWPTLWPITALAALFVTASLLDLFVFLPVWLHGLIVLGSLFAFFAGLYRAWIRMPRIGETGARHRIERDSDLAHRPLTALNDKLALGADDALAAGLWQAHLRRMAEQSENLRLRMPHAGLVGRDGWGLRAAVAVLLIIGFIAAGSDSLTRIGQGLVPPTGGGTAGKGAELNVWITPPAYTGAPPVVLHAGGADGKARRATASDGPIEVPTGSTLFAQLAGGGRVPNLVIGKRETAFERIDADSYHLETALTAGTSLKVTQGGREIGSWPIAIIPDLAPIVEFSAAPETVNRTRIALPYAASDDYGLKSLAVSIRRLDGVAVPDGEDEIILRLPLPGGKKQQVTGKSNHDLIAHVWAGLPVLVHLIATDERDATGLSSVEPLVLPERRFGHPVARELYDIRKRLTARDRDRRLAMLKIDAVSDEPKRFNDDSSIYLALRVARERLRQDPRERAVAEVQRILWDSALKLEEGLAADANRDLLAAQQALQEALDRNASPEELERLMSELREAMDKFMAALMREMQDRGELMEIDPSQQVTDMMDLQKMLEQAQELMRQGSRDAAKEMMSQLQRMLDQLRNSLAQRGNQQQRQQMSEAQRQAQREAQQAMREMQDIIQQQQQLLDDTYRQQREQQSRRQQPGQQPQRPGEQNQNRGQQGQQGEQGEADQQALDERQKELRRRLGELMGKLGDMLGQVPPALGDAERAMRESEQALGQGQPGDAIDPESRALEALREGAQQGAQAMMQQLAPGQGQGQGKMQFGFNPSPGGQFGQFLNGPMLQGLRPGNRDPFGRELREGGQGEANGDVKIPGQSGRALAREILDELRRRLSDPWRSDIEIDYLRRLLKLF